jgi:hypothetical protein
VVYQPPARGCSKRGGLTVTVMKRGSMSFTEEAWAAIGSPEAVLFLVDRDRRDRVVGFRACEPHTPGSRDVTPETRMVSAMAVMTFLKHDRSVSRRYPLHMEDGKPPYIDLSEDAPVVPGSGGKARQPAGRP